MYAAMSNRPNNAQIEALVDFLERNPGIAKGSLRTALGKDLVKKRWNEVSSFLNGLGTVTKDGKGWAKFWAEKKCVLKKKCLQLQVGPLEDPPTFSDLEKRMVTMIGVAEISENSLEENNLDDAFNNYSETNEERDTKSPLLNRSPHGDYRETASPLRPSYDDGMEHITNSRHSSHEKRGKKRHAHSAIDASRLEAIEEKRAKAERTRSSALRGLGSDFSTHTAAVEGLTMAVRRTGQTVAAGVQAAGQNIANAIMKISKRINAS